MNRPSCFSALSVYSSSEGVFFSWLCVCCHLISLSVGMFVVQCQICWMQSHGNPPLNEAYIPRSWFLQEHWESKGLQKHYEISTVAFLWTLGLDGYLLKSGHCPASVSYLGTWIILRSSYGVGTSLHSAGAVSVRLHLPVDYQAGIKLRPNPYPYWAPVPILTSHSLRGISSSPHSSGLHSSAWPLTQCSIVTYLATQYTCQSELCRQ